MDSNNGRFLRDLLHAAYKDRGIPYKSDELEAALKDPLHAEWVNDNLRPDTLLSKEEANLYEKLESSGSLPNALQAPGLASTRPLLDHEITAAIEDLKTSTAAIDAQTEALKSQCKQLRFTLGNEKEVGRWREKVLGEFQDRNVKETQEINIATGKLRHDFEAKVENTRGMLVADNNALGQRISNLLKEHDRTLEGFEELAFHLQGGENDDLLAKRAAKLTAKLGRFLAGEIHCRLDRLYLESIRESSPAFVDEGYEDQADQLTSIEQEISSLYSEIDILAEMGSGQKFQALVLQALQDRRQIFNSTSDKHLDNILSAMIQLTTFTEQLGERVQGRHSHRAALNELATVEKHARESKPSTTPTGVKCQQRHDATPQDMLKDTAENSPKNGDDFPCLDNILRRSNLSLATLLQVPSSSSDYVVGEKKEAMIQLLESCYGGTSTPLLPYLEAADKTAQLLASSLHSNSKTEYPSGNGKQGQTLDALEAQLNNIRMGIEGLDLDILSGNLKQEKFVERWG